MGKPETRKALTGLCGGAAAKAELGAGKKPMPVIIVIAGFDAIPEFRHG